MEIYREPADYQAVGNEVIFGITGADTDKTIEVEIKAGKENNLIGIKRFRGASDYTVNVAGYLRGQMNVHPVATAKTEAVKAETRCVQTKIVVGNVASQETIITAGTLDAPLFERLSDAPEKTTIALGETDEIAWFAPQCEASIRIRFEAVTGEKLEITTENLVCDDHMTVLAINTIDLEERIRQDGRTWEEFNTMDVCIAFDDQTHFSKQYVLNQNRHDSVRMCWVNRYGALDYHTFPACAEERVEIAKTRMHGNRGVETLDSESQTCRLLLSEYEPRNVMQWLATLAAAPKAWTVHYDAEAGGYTFLPVDVESKQVVVCRDGELSRAEITVKQTRKTKH